VAVMCWLKDVCIYTTNMYIKKEGAMSHAPFYGKIASCGYIITFAIAIIIKYVFNHELTSINYWYFLPVIFILWYFKSFFKGQRTQSIDNLKENVSEIERISLSDVKAEEMIKSEISINPEFIGLKVDTKSSDELIIEQALKKKGRIG